MQLEQNFAEGSERESLEDYPLLFALGSVARKKYSGLWVLCFIFLAALIGFVDPPILRNLMLYIFDSSSLFFQRIHEKEV